MSSEAGEGASSSSTPTKEQVDAKMKALNILAQGKRNLICGEVPLAVQQFQDACQTLSTSFGEMAKECAEAYFHYGSALLDLSRMEQGVLGNALEGVDVDAEDEGETSNKEQFETTAEISGDDKTSQDSDDKADSGEKTEDTEEGDEEEEEDGEEEEEEGEGQEDEEAKDEEDADDVSNLQLAWEMLELSKVIYSKEPSKECQLKAAEACLKLGEVSLESEQYEQAICDLEKCLQIRKEHLASYDRSIAETYYQIGLACQMNKQLDQAKESFKAAGTCLEEKIKQLEAIIKEKPPKDPSQFLEPAEQAEKEIEDIKKILPEIQEKIKDTEDESKEMENLKLMAKEAMGAVFSAVDSTTETGFGTSSSSPVKSTEAPKTSNITHLIRKKRKPDEEDKKDEEDLVEKKPKQDDSSGDATGMNGHSETKNDKTEAIAAT